ncbi:MAG: DNA replication/repair protein RecF [Acidimicrobiia bacterium]|nr:DNA replication/repair protein RecF [Acidimicrobiia bacterium]NNC74151.1 DNA replication/repair protein RecF [Acidimicrobiia bacterium]
MHLAWLSLRDFRSYPQLELRPGPGLNVLVGRNGAGKTSVLEAIAYLSGLKSFRRVPDDALIRTGADAAVLRGGFTTASGEYTVEVELPREGRRRVLANAKRPKRFSDVAGEVPVVAFLPDDIDMVKRGPAYRREYLDDLAAQLSPVTRQDQSDFERALRQRNALLRNEGPDASDADLDAWDTEVANTGGRVAAARLGLVDRLGPVLTDTYARVGGNDRVSWRYEPNWAEPISSLEAVDRSPETLAAAILEKLGERRRIDKERRSTTVGPQRDDITFLLGDRSTRTQASQGEQRSMALAMRVGAYELIRDGMGTPPVLLLDDVFSELDSVRVEGVVDLLPAGQVLVTTARQDDVPMKGTAFDVVDGVVSEVNAGV